jgi:hypothetical protein
MAQIKGMPVPVPPKVELGEALTRLSLGLDVLQETGEGIEAQVGVSAQLRQSILAAAFKGDLV